MADLAQLGIEINTSSVKSATTDLDAFSTAAKTSQQSVEQLAASTGKSETIVRAIDSSAKRAGTSFDEMNSRFDAASASVGKHSATMENAASSHAKLSGAAHGAASELGRMDEIAAILESRMLKLGNNVGLFGEVLQVIGPQGLAVAAGIGAIVVAVDMLVSSANRMSEFAAKLAEIS